LSALGVNVWRSRFGAFALVSILVGLCQAALPVSALAGPPDPTTGKTTSRPAPKKRPVPNTVVFATSQSQFDPGINNQGWWTEITPNSDANDNYIVGPYNGEYRNFFTFDVSTLDKHVVSATLRLNTAMVLGIAGTETLRLSDVSTDAARLNENVGLNADIFSDLGTGSVYGEYAVGSVGDHEELSLELNKAALRDLKHAAKHAPDGFFSIGGSLSNAPQGAFIFGDSGSLPVELVVRTR
jgi:hypothetical protein